MELSWTETLGFLSGALCVWLIVSENVWNWPLGLANNVFYFLVFFRSRLFADMSLQTIFFALGVYGWWNWVFGGARKNELSITHTSRAEFWVLTPLIPIATLGLQQVLTSVHDAAPFMDALTTVLSLAAQYLMTRKRLEHWWLWIIADILYIPLYLNRQLPLTALLYFGFLLLCIAGLRQWRRTISTTREPHPAIG